MTAAIYRGHAQNSVDEGGPQVVTVERNGKVKALRHRVRHSPDGFQWGYGGSGPADLARSLLWDHLGAEPEPAMYQEFKRQVIAAFTLGACWTFTAEQVQAWIDRYDANGAA